MHASSFARVKTLIGFEPEEMMGLHAYDFFHPSDFKACQPNSERAIKCRLTCKLCVRVRENRWRRESEGDHVEEGE